MAKRAAKKLHQNQQRQTNRILRDEAKQDATVQILDIKANHAKCKQLQSYDHFSAEKS
jgi:hypothetical protein